MPTIEDTSRRLLRLRKAQKEIRALRIKDNLTVRGGIRERTAAAQARRRQEREIRVEAEGISAELLERG